MVSYEFYQTEYGGSSVPETEFPTLARDAAAQLTRYKRIYQVHIPTAEPDPEQMALCAMVDALYYFQVAQSGGLASSVSVGSVSSSRAQSAVPDVSPAAQAAELYRCASLYLEIYRGPGGAECLE